MTRHHVLPSPRAACTIASALVHELKRAGGLATASESCPIRTRRKPIIEKRGPVRFTRLIPEREHRMKRRSPMRRRAHESERRALRRAASGETGWCFPIPPIDRRSACWKDLCTTGERRAARTGSASPRDGYRQRPHAGRRLSPGAARRIGRTVRTPDRASSRFTHSLFAGPGRGIHIGQAQTGPGRGTSSLLTSPHCPTAPVGQPPMWS